MLSAVLMSSFIFLFIISFFGSQLGLADIQPARFIIVLLVLAVFIISRMVEREREMDGKIFFFLCITALTIISINPQFRFGYNKVYILGISTTKSSQVEFTCGYSGYDEASDILDFIKLNTTRNTRIHVQDSVIQGYHPYFNSHFTAFIPYATSREILAAPSAQPPTSFAFSQFVDDNIFGKKLSQIPGDELKEYLELYNVKYILIFNESTGDYFDRNGFERIFESGIYRIYEYPESSESFCYNCTAVVNAGYDRIFVENASTGTTILKYHYLETLKTRPDTMEIKPILLMDDPVPFIMVENGNNSEFLVYNP
jgi:hypothetical protein